MSINLPSTLYLLSEFREGVVCAKDGHIETVLQVLVRTVKNCTLSFQSIYKMLVLTIQKLCIELLAFMYIYDILFKTVHKLNTQL